MVQPLAPPTRKMGQGTRGGRPPKAALIRTMVLAMPFAGLAMLFLYANRNHDTAAAATPPLSDATRHYDWGLGSLTNPAYSRHPPHDNRAPESRLASGSAHQPVNPKKQLPSCVADTDSPRPFLMLFMGHSGSTAIITELRNHSGTLVKVSEPIDHNEYAKNTSLALAYTREAFMKGKKEGKVVGFKMRPWHIRQNPDAWIALTKEFKTRIIWQYRQNILKQAVGEYSYKYYSDESAVEGLRSHDELQKRCSTGAGCRFKITDFKFFHLMLKDSLHSDLAITRAVHLVLNGSTCVHEMPYEDYLYDREDAMRRLQEFLGLQYEETAPSRFKATSDSLCEVVENWNEVCEKFYGCHVWRHMFDDRQNNCMCEFTSGPVEYCDTLFDNKASVVPR